MGGRNLARYPRCPKCHQKRDVGCSTVPSSVPWYCRPCDVFFRVHDGFSIANGLEPYPSDIKEVFYCRTHYREHLGVCPFCKSESARLEVAHAP